MRSHYAFSPDQPQSGPQSGAGAAKPYDEFMKQHLRRACGETAELPLPGDLKRLLNDLDDPLSR